MTLGRRGEGPRGEDEADDGEESADVKWIDHQSMCGGQSVNYRRDVSFTPRSKWDALNDVSVTEMSTLGFVSINGAKLDYIRDQTEAKPPLIKQFELTALGLNEPLHKLARLVWRMSAAASTARVTAESWISFRV